MNGFKRFSVFLGCAVSVWGLIAPTSAQELSHEILFTDGDIKVIDTYTHVVTQLTQTDGYDTNPVWSPDSSQIAYSEMLTTDYYGSYGLYVIDADGRNKRQLAADLMWLSNPIWLDDGETILYATSAQADGGDCLISTVKRDGSAFKEVFRKIHSACRVSYLNPALSPDGTHILFSLDDNADDKYFQLYVMSLADGRLTKLTDKRATHAAPQWSPDGTQIAYVSNQDKQDEIYVMNADGSNPRRLTHRAGDDIAPQWLPDNQHLIFASDQDGYNLFNLDTVKGVVQNLTSNPKGAGAWSAAVSPDGTQIAYLIGQDPVGGPEGVRIMNLVSGETYDLLNIGIGAFGLSWKP